ncbi:MAG TPA: segregation/condensation protein A [Solirubrobacteraceae bacterium]|nr:segregation/condensation protein A [Solirubrobacteraceae bacterium]
MTIAALELDLDVFSGPFDLLLALVLREEVDLLELELADVVLAYLDHLEARGELDLEAATEFIVLVAALLELKSRMMLGEDDEELLDVAPGEAAEELLARMLQARRYRDAAGHLTALLAGEHGVRYRSAPPPAFLRRGLEQAAREGAHNPERLAKAIGGLLRMPPEISLRHVTIARVTLPERLDHLRGLLRRHRGAFSFEEAVRDTDRMTVAVTLFALLELHRRGEATWEQGDPFGEISVLPIAQAPAVAAGGAL